VQTDLKLALKWYRAAAKTGYAGAEFSLGVAYFRGAGVARDAHEAVKWFQKAATHGSVTAAGILGLVYDRGLGVSRDHATAAKWKEAAGDAGVAQALRMLSSLDPPASEQSINAVAAVPTLSNP